MSAAAPILYEEGTTTPLAPWDFGSVLAAAESAEQLFDVANVGAAAETVTEASLGVLVSTDDGLTWTQDHPLTLERWVQLQAYGVTGTGIAAQVTDWTPVGVGARLVLTSIPGDTRRKIKAKVALPAGVSSASLQIMFVLYWREGYIPLGQGLYEAGIHGVIGGTGDPTYAGLLSGGALTETGTPDGNVQVADYAAKVAGLPVVEYAQAVALAASAAGLARWVTISAGPSGPTLTQQSPEVTAPSPVASRPALPAGQPLLGYVHRDDGTIVTADIYTADAVRSPFGLALAALVATLGPGRGIVDNRLVWRDKTTGFTLADDQETIFYVLPDSTISAVAAGSAPSSLRAEPIWSVTVASGVVTATRDLRNFLGPRLHTFDAFFTGLAVDDAAAYWTSPVNARLYVRLPRGVSLSVGSIGDRAAGALHVPLEYWDGAAWTSMFSSTSKDPQLAFGATVLAVDSFLPDRVEVAPGTRLRFRQETTSLTGGTTNPANVHARVDFEEVGL